MKEEGFNAAGRRAALETLDRPRDLVVVGGGINGCGIALEAARRGYDVLLLEQGDLGSGTSSRSSRLIHGGLRYLRHGHLKLVWEASLERHRLRRRFPHLVRPLPFLIPVYEGEGEGLPATLFGLGMYDLLSAYTNVQTHDRLRPQEVLEREPRLRAEGLQGGGVYYDCWTDDSRLVLENAKRAHRAGAHLVPYARATDLLWEGDRVAGVALEDRLEGTAHAVRSRAVVNATGPWGDLLRARASRRPALRLTKGVHVLLPRERVGNREAVVLRSPRDGRIVFVLPWGPLALVGTTDTDHAGNPDEVRAEADDVAYLLEALNHGFPDVQADVQDVVSAYAALRPLTGDADVPATEVSRDYRILRDAPGLLSLVGGKLTTYRRVAQKVVRALRRDLGPPPRTPSIVPGQGAEDPERLEAWLRDRAADGLAGPETAAYLVHAYGPEVRVLLRYLQREGGDDLVVPGLPYRWGQVRYAVDHEMALRLVDVLVRRTRLLLESPTGALEVAERAASEMGARLGWSERRHREELEAVRSAVGRAVGFREA